jgi:methyltransferase family protein
VRRLAETIETVLERISRRDRRPTMVHVILSVQELLDRFPSQVEAIETGTIRTHSEHHESTRLIAETVGDRGTLTSVDSSREAIQVSREICRHLHNIEWVEAESTAYLSRVEGRRYHFAFLDSANDQDVIFEEFSLVTPLIVEDGIVMVDDAGITSTLKAVDRRRSSVKGHRVWQFLDSCGAEYEVLRTPRGHGTQLRIRLGSQNRARIISALGE